MMYLAQNLKYLRKSKNLLQEEIGKIIGVGKQAVSNWEGGVSTPNIEVIIAIARYFDVTLDDLVLKDLRSPTSMYARNIRYLREKAGLKQDDMADLVKMSKASMAKVESGEIGISVDNLEKIGDFFGVTMDRLVKEDLTGGE